LKLIIFLVIAISLGCIVREYNEEFTVAFTNLLNKGIVEIDQSKYILTKEKLREIIDYKNANVEKLKIIKAESNQIKLSISDQKFKNIKLISTQINVKVKQLEQFISDYYEIKTLRQTLSDKIAELEE